MPLTSTPRSHYPKPCGVRSKTYFCEIFILLSVAMSSIEPAFKAAGMEKRLTFYMHTIWPAWLPIYNVYIQWQYGQ